MTLQERQAVYEELGKMFVQLEPAPERGLDYVKDRIGLCRAMQDRVGELLLKVNRAYSESMEGRMRAQQSYEVDVKSVTKDQINNLKAEEAAHKLLVTCIKGQSTLLGRTGQDIRLLADIIKDQIKRGEIDPRDSPGLVKDTTPEEALAGVRAAGLGPPTVTPEEPPKQEPPEVPAPEPEPRPDPEPVPPPTPSAMADFSAVLGGANGNGESPVSVVETAQPVVSFVDMGKDPIEPFEPMRLPETKAVSLDDLFSQESINGSSRSPF